MTAPKATIAAVSTEAAPYVPQTTPVVVVRVREPHQIYYDRIVFIGGDTVELPPDVATRYTAAGWVEPTE